MPILTEKTGISLPGCAGYPEVPETPENPDNPAKGC